MMMKPVLRALGLPVFLINKLSAGPAPDAYFDPTDQRIHASVETEIGSSQLQLNISATGSCSPPTGSR